MISEHCMMRIYISRYAFLVALMVLLWATESMAATIGFDGLTGPNLSSFTDPFHPYGEDGFTVAATGGQWFEAHIFGNGVPAIGAGPVYNADPGAPQTITVTGGTFTFGGVDLTSNVAGGTSYTIQGFLATSGVASIFEQTVIIGGSGCSSNCNINTFYSINSSSTVTVDKLTITGTRAADVTSFNIDNIRVSAASGSCPGPDPNCPHPTVPEPASIMLLGAGLAGIEIWRRKRG
jgi:hypothetical protein